MYIESPGFGAPVEVVIPVEKTLDERAKEIIITAERLLDRNGWTQGREQNAAGQYCLLGALKAASGIPIRSNLFLNEYLSDLQQVHEHVAFQRAMYLITSYIAKKHGMGTIIVFNDHQSGRRGKKRVKKTLREVAKTL